MKDPTLKTIRTEATKLKAFVGRIPVRKQNGGLFERKGNIDYRSFGATLKKSGLSTLQKITVRAAFNASYPSGGNAETNRARVKHALDVSAQRLAKLDTNKNGRVSTGEIKATKFKTTLALHKLAKSRVAKK